MEGKRKEEDVKDKRGRSRNSGKTGGGEYNFDPENGILGIITFGDQGRNSYNFDSHSLC